MGWPNAWSAFRVVKEVYADDTTVENHGGMFGIGEANTAYAKYFIGNSYLKPLTNPNETVFVANVTFEPGCRNNWHVHHATSGGGQLLLCVDGEGWYQEEGKEPQSLKAGDIVAIPAGVKHWHGAKANSWFSHLAVECPGENTSNEWFEPVDDEHYPKRKLKGEKHHKKNNINNNMNLQLACILRYNRLCCRRNNTSDRQYRNGLQNSGFNK